MLKRIKNSIGLRKMVIFRKKTGIYTEIKSKLPDNSSIEHVAYNNSSDVPAEDLIGIKSLLSEEGFKKILRWWDRPNYKLFATKLNGEIVHFGLVIICKKGDSLGMADEGDLMIMTCHTSEKHRRKGLYRVNLGYICSNWKLSKWAYINTRVENIPSQKGIEAAGFERMGVYKYFSIGRCNVHIRKCGD